MARLTSKRVVLLVVLVGAAVLLVSGSRTWVSGSVSDAVLGASLVHGTGSQVAPGVLAAALVAAASAVAAATSGRVVRVVALAAMGLAALLALYVIGTVVAHPSVALGRIAATSTGRTGSVPAHGVVTVWVWVAGLAAVAVAFGGAGAMLGARRWSGLSSRYDAPVTAGEPTAGEPIAGELTDEELTGGEPTGREPTAGEPTTRDPAATGSAMKRAATTAPDANAPVTRQPVNRQPVASGETKPARRPQESAWDQISRGEDPTAGEDPGKP
jgi:hypothetical protein